ncbi:hypothetical protein FHG87_004568 [Trinorchestia longiramus]|nr:hypothetical protein FHG87_004568 [Trinorchestia longiramus]
MSLPDQGGAGSSSRLSRAPLPTLPQSDSSKPRTSSLAPNLSLQSRRALPVPKSFPSFVPPIHPSIPNITPCNTKQTTYCIQLKTIDHNKPTDRDKILEVTFCDLDAPIIQLTKTRTGYYAVTDDATIIDKLTSNEATEAFEKINLIPIEPQTFVQKELFTNIRINTAQTLLKSLNCQGPHRTLAAGCTYRKTIINQKRDDEQKQKEQQTHNTYAKIAKHAIQQTNPPQHALTLTNQTHLKHTALILEAHIAALDKTQKFGEILSKQILT